MAKSKGCGCGCGGENNKDQQFKVTPISAAGGSASSGGGSAENEKSGYTIAGFSWWKILLIVGAAWFMIENYQG